MYIKTRVKEGSFVELQIESGNTRITEDLATLKSGKWVVPENEIEQFVTIANECSRFNGTSDVDFVKKIFDAFLSDHEKSEFLESVAQHSI
jgi:hypothetical protein